MVKQYTDRKRVGWFFRVGGFVYCRVRVVVVMDSNNYTLSYIIGLTHSLDMCKLFIGIKTNKFLELWFLNLLFPLRYVNTSLQITSFWCIMDGIGN